MAKAPACFAMGDCSQLFASPASGRTLQAAGVLRPTARVYGSSRDGTSRHGESALAWGVATGLLASVAGQGRTRRRAFLQNPAGSEAARVRNDEFYHRLRERLAQYGAPERNWELMERLYFKRARLTAGIDFGKYDDIEVEMLGGKGDEEPVQSFEELCQKYELPEELVANIKLCNYSKPTPVQKYSMPAVLSGSDVMVSAQTGSGKTAAFMTPIISTVLNAGEPELQPGAARPKALILAPTRELVQQLATEAKRLTHRTFIRIASVYGGAPQKEQLSDLAEGGHLVIATPGRLDDFVKRRLVTMEDVEFLALDEADRMLDMGFEPQIRSIIDNSGMPEPGIEGEGRRTMMFSATFPQEMQDMALDFLHPSYLWIGVGRVGEAASSVDQRFEDLGYGDKQQALVKILQSEKNDDGGMLKTIVFTNMKRTANELCWHLKQNGTTAVPCHGDLDQVQRDLAISSLKNGRASVLVATDVAARGLDIPGVDHVVNYDLPPNAEDYTHRIGRTGRIGNRGIATSFVGHGESGLKGILKSLKKSQEADDTKEIPDWLIERAYS